MASYSIWIPEYAKVVEYPVGGVLYGQHNEGHLVLPYCYGVLQGEGHTAIVDCGFNWADYGQVLAETYGVSHWQPPETVLGRIGIDPAEVDTLILTHNHFDHAGGVDLFPNAHVYLQAKELHHYLWAKGLPERLQWLTTACDPDLVLQLAQRMKDDKLTLLDGEAEILPGVRAMPAHDTHTAGSQYVIVDNEHDGRWVMAGDNMYVYENVTGLNDDGRYVPIGLAFGSKERCLLTTEEMYQAAGTDVRRIVPFHEGRLFDRFPSRVFDDELHVAELSLRPGDTSRLDAPASSSASVAAR